MADTKKTSVTKTAKPVSEKQPVATAKPITATTKSTAKKAASPMKKPTAKPTTEAKTAPIVKSLTAPAVTQKLDAPTAKERLAAPTTENMLKKPTESATVKISATVKTPLSSKTREVKKVLFVSGEVLPFAASGGLGEVAGSLPKAIVDATDKGYDVRVVMPYYKAVITADYQSVMEYVGNRTVSLAWRNQYCGLFKLVRGGVTYYFLDNEYYFKRNNLYGEYDDGERFAFFSKAVLDMMPLMEFYPDILHCNDWQSALVPVYYKLYYMYNYPYERIKTIFTIHNIEYQGKFSYNCCEDLFGVPARECGTISHGDCINLMRAAIDYSDAVTTVSPTYANEIKSDYFAHGLASIINKNSGKLCGILNGIDVVGYNPSTDKSLFLNFDAKTLDKKVKNKVELQKMLNLTVDEKIPMVAMITRLVAHKGVDLVKYAADALMNLGIQLVVLGTGNGEYEAFFSHLAVKYPNRVATLIAYNKDISRKIYGGADIFLMPSKSEPCGLSQMIASRYATVPVVRETGGLYDSIKDCDDGTKGNGYTFATYNADDMVHAVERAVGLYKFYPELWKSLMHRIIEVDFSWNRSAQEYIKLYDQLIGD